MGDVLGYKSMEDWYQVTLSDFSNNDGKALVKMFKENFFRIVMDAFPHHNWQASKFANSNVSDWSTGEKLEYMKNILNSFFPSLNFLL